MRPATPREYLRGIYNIVPTPFAASGALDEASLARLIEFVIGTGVDGVTILGFLGEAGKLSEAERTRVIEVTVATTDGRIPVVVGATHASTDRSVAFAREAGMMENPRCRRFLATVHCNLAGFLALASEGKGAPGERGAPVPPEEADATQKSAVDHLREALDLGWTDIDSFTNHSAMASLFNRADFKALLAAHRKKR